MRLRLKARHSSAVDPLTRPGARVLFRTAAVPTMLPGRLDDAILSKWRYLEEHSADLTARDRSSIYGGVHVYELA